MVLIVGDRLMPLRPMPCSRKPYGQAHGLASHSAQERVVASLRALDLEASLGASDRREVLVWADRGDDNNNIAPAMAAKGWHFLIALRKTRRVTSAARSLTTPTAQPWCPIDTVFRRHRRRTWDTLRLATRGNKRKRMDVRVRHTSGDLRYVGKVALGCSARRHRPEGRRTSLAGKDRRATARQSVPGYRRRWAVELFPTSVQQNLGFEAVATQGFDAVIPQVPWVDCAYSLRHRSPPGLSPRVQSW